MQNIAGSPVEGADFFGRETAIRSFWDILGNHDILLLGPRRIGKTSLARRLMIEARQSDWRAIEVNVASCIDERTFVDKLTTEVKHAAGSWTVAFRDGLAGLMNRISGISLPGDVGVELSAKQETWEAIASETLTLLAQQPGETLIYVDELPIFLFNMLRYDPSKGEERVRRFLDWFRNDARNVTRYKNLHWLISGSVGLDTLVQRHGMADTINSLRHQSLEPYGHAEALALLERLAQSFDLPFTLDDRERLVSAIGWPQPYYLQLAFQNVRHMRRENQPIADIIDAAVDSLIQPGEDNDFHHWSERLYLQLNQSDAELSVALLKLACRDRIGATGTALFAELQRRLPDLSEDQQEHRFIRLRDVLIRDAYWVRSETDGTRRYRFLLEPLRRWWLNRHTL
jgi:hypothetical protein